MATVIQQVTKSDVSGDRGKDVTGWVIRGRFDATDKGAARVIKALENLGLAKLFDIDEDIPIALKPTHSDSRSTAIRKWAKDNNMKISERGRLPFNVINAYDEAVSNV